MLEQAIVDQVRRNAVTYPDRIAIEEIGSRSLNYREVWQRILSIAAALDGVPAIDGRRLVALLLPNGADAILSQLACQWAGCVAVPINGALSVTEIDEIVADSGCMTILTAGRLRAFVDKLSSQLTVIDCADIPGGPETAPGRAVTDGDAPMIVGYTSGTTGLPKGAVFSNDAMFIRFLRWGWQFGLTRRDVVLSAGPLFHLSYSGISIVALMVGARIRVQHQFKAAEAYDELSERCSFAFLVPTMLRAILTVWEENGRREMPAARSLLSSGSPVPRSMLAQALEAFPNATIAEAYGWSEGSWVTYEVKELETLRPQCVGWPMIGADIVIFDEQYELCDVGNPGEIATRDLIGFSGYLNRPQETQSAYHDGYILSGDIGVFDSDGRLRVIDRKKDMIVSGGENIYSAEVERVLLGHPDVTEAAVVGRPHSYWGEVVTAVVVSTNPATDSEAIRLFCSGRLAAYKVPKYVEFVTELPRNAMGKVQKFRLRGKGANSSPVTAAESSGGSR